MMPLSTAMVQTGAAQKMAKGWWTSSATPALRAAGRPVHVDRHIGPIDQQHGNGTDHHSGRHRGLEQYRRLAATGADERRRGCRRGVFLTPIATPTNLMVMGPGGYKFGDYWKLGLPLMIWFGLIATFYVPVIWRF